MGRLSKSSQQAKTSAETASQSAGELFSSRILREDIGLVLVPEPADRPTPGKFYQIKSGDTLFGIARKAYDSGSMEAARRINDSRYNRRFWKTAPASEQKMFPHGRISFSPKFDGDLRVQMESEDRAPTGTSFATIWIPAVDGAEPF